MNRILYASRWSIINKNPHTLTAATQYLQRSKQLSTYPPGLFRYRARSTRRPFLPGSGIPLSTRTWSLRPRSNMSGDDMNDPALKAAIEASLRDIHGPGDEHGAVPSGSQRKVVDLTADSDGDSDDVVEVYPKSKDVISPEDEEEVDADLKRAIELSMQDVDCPEVERDGDDPKGKKALSPKPSCVEESDKTPPIQKTEPKSSQSTGIAGLDRKQMEQERLARLTKRKAEDIPSEQPEAKHLRTEEEPSKSSIKVRSKTERPTATPSIQFPTGAVKKTWNTNSLRNNEDITIEEVFQSSDVELAVLSSFMWDMEWLFEKFNISKTRFIMIMQAKEESTKRQYESETATMRTLRLCFPPMEGQVNCMHSKLMLLFHPNYVRIVVPTANLTPFDWGCTRDSLENSVFLIDLPKKTGQDTAPKTAFHEELAYFLKASTLHENVIAKLDNFDFSQTAHIAFVHTIGGSHIGESWRRTGYCGLGRAVESLGLQTSKPVNIDYVTSSLGSLNDEFLRSIYLAAQGDNGLTEYTHRTSKPSTKKPNQQQEKQQPAPEWKNNRFRVYFPSQTTVAESHGGPSSAGTICFQSRWYEGGKFPREILRDCESTRRYLLMHNKIIYIRPDEPIPLPDNNTCPAWAYIGSANLSESAWGRLVQDRSAKAPKLNCRNWECGVVVPVLEQGRVLGGEDKGKGKARADTVTTESGVVDAESPTALVVFDSTVPVPMCLPGKRYEGTRKPWYFMD